MIELPADRRAHLAWLHDLTVLPAGGLAVDFGCGQGTDLLLLATRYHATHSRFVGVDRSDEAGAALKAIDDPRISFQRADLAERLPFDDATVDLAYSHNLMECLPDSALFVSEIARVLRPGGLAVIAHWDWDTQVYDGTDKNVVRRLVAGFADWQQAWMPHADGWMGRRLWGAFAGAGQLTGALHSRVLTNTDFSAPWFGHANALAMQGLVKRALASPDDYQQFLREQEQLQHTGRYVYGITAFAYVGYRNAI